VAFSGGGLYFKQKRLALQSQPKKLHEYFNLALEDGTDRLSRNVGTEPKRAQISFIVLNIGRLQSRNLLFIYDCLSSFARAENSSTLLPFVHVCTVVDCLFESRSKLQVVVVRVGSSLKQKDFSRPYNLANIRLDDYRALQRITEYNNQKQSKKEFDCLVTLDRSSLQIPRTSSPYHSQVTRT